MAASIILTTLPKDAHAALEGAGDLAQAKGGHVLFPCRNTVTDALLVTVRFQAVGSAPALRQRVFKISSTRRFETVVNFLRKKLSMEQSEGIFCYVNSVFAPALDEVVGNLWRCFKTGDELVVAYAKMQAFG